MLFVGLFFLIYKEYFLGISCYLLLKMRLQTQLKGILQSSIKPHLCFVEINVKLISFNCFGSLDYQSHYLNCFVFYKLSSNGTMLAYLGFFFPLWKEKLSSREISPWYLSDLYKGHWKLQPRFILRLLSWKICKIYPNYNYTSPWMIL